MGLLPAATLMIDYLLDVGVGISTGVGALVSAVPALAPYTLTFCLLILLILTVISLRGARESGVLFLAPTLVFILSLIAVLGWVPFMRSYLVVIHIPWWRLLYPQPMLSRH